MTLERWLSVETMMGTRSLKCDAATWELSGGVVARIVTGPHEANRQGPHLPMRYDTGRPRAVTRFRIAVNQFTVVESQHERRPDLALFVNGLPLVVVE